MAKVIYFTACTLDGFIADEHDSLDWLFEVPGGAEDGSWERFIAGVGPMAMGRTTYEWVLEHEDLVHQPEKWQQWYGDRPCWVFTHRDLPALPGADVRFVHGDVRRVHDEMLAVRDGDVWIVGGGDLVGQFDDAGLLNEIHLAMCPVTLGAGAPLLPRRITSRRLTLRSVEQAGQQVRMVLDVARSAPS
ncbi:dihydrofolate reductase family protein [Amnibacterium sp. CER49]|uniref:dihydrofolate reductase family protein n=1 Tax=Amnibacterium sp. CER49 TaxID=3039161 RepID=UPI0024470816|nr:dihydrofolate reductase family protein [Amnibacterium sp. CER49]MDH2444886.1 dihydrofolate reductase family protein [Amnibacterium sp. CER49]